MKIVNREEFLKLPANTLYAKCTSHHVGEPAIKEESTGNDWYYMDIGDLNTEEDHSSEDYFDILGKMDKTGVSYPNDYSTLDRDGLYDNDQKFMIWEKEDLDNLIGLLNKCKKNYE